MPQNYKQKPAFQYGHEINEICQPLFSNTDIGFFEFIRSQNDGSYITYCSSLDWLDHYFKEELHKDTCFHGKADNYKKSYILTENLKHSQNIVKDCKEQFKINNCLAVVCPCEKHVDTFLFGSETEDKRIYDFYFNNIDLLDRFIYYFYDTASTLIDRHAKDRYKFPHNSSSVIKEELSSFERKVGLKRSLEVNNYNLQGICDCSLSKREVECLYWLEQGKTSDEIGIILNISGRTVESHLSRIKKKLNCYKMSRLVSIIKEYGVL
ncbi:MAG: LuxR C-terminal-related transcriptional regulator [Flavobacteriales bacterium]|nr:LuxR C-terminal-related transcriptional regulator [Flavobacteriales bacterium]